MTNQPRESDDHLLDRRRVPRLFLTKEQFKLEETGKVYSVYDLSQSGLSLRILEGDDLLYFPVGRTITGNLNLAGEKHAVSLQVHHVRREIVGCEFVHLDKKLSHRLRAFLDPAELGKELRAMTGFESSGFWYHGSRGTDLFLWRGRDGQYIKFGLYLYGQFVLFETDSREGLDSGALVEATLSTGRILPTAEPSEHFGLVHLESLQLERDEKADAHKLKAAMTVIENSPLPAEARSWIIRRMKPHGP